MGNGWVTDITDGEQVNNGQDLGVTSGAMPIASMLTTRKPVCQARK
ncbi:MAG: hypothetical protein F6K53_00475 [Moorea sp. SIO4A1]|nr:MULTISPECIES: hypothetical protein [Moorena]NEQ55959.1 hypothetical protein [Moorena sp. SIO4A1]